MKDYLNAITISENAKINSKMTGEQRAVSYIMIYTFVNLIFRWTLARICLSYYSPPNPETAEFLNYSYSNDNTNHNNQHNTSSNFDDP